VADRTPPNGVGLVSKLSSNALARSNQMKTCQGVRSNSVGVCGSTVYRCKKCGRTGCDQSGTVTCTQQEFKDTKCVACGGIYTKELAA
jgi:hypothetical protein